MKVVVSLKRLLLSCITALALALPAMAVPFVPDVPLMDVGEIRTGMRGEAHTVLKGTTVETFPVTILSVIPRKGLPRHLILIRAEGPLIEKTGGIAAGMSGSPVFIDGKIIGAIGYGWDFSDHRLGLVTPIEDMSSVFEWKDENPPFYKAPLKLSAEPASRDAISSDDTSSDDVNDEENPAENESQDVSVLPGKEPASRMTLFADGMSSRSLSDISANLGQRVLSMGGNNSDKLPPVEKVGRMKPGEAVGVLLAWGDVTLGATGTLTASSKDGRFLAFGHPFINKGAVAYPLTRAWVHEVIPSIESPFKLGTPLSIIGTVTQDRPQAIGGRLNFFPPSFDFTVNFDDVDNKRTARKRFHVAMDPFLLSKISPEAMSGMVDDLWGQVGQGTARLNLKVTGPNLSGGWSRNNIFFSDKDLTKEALKEFKELVEIIALNPFVEVAPLGFQLDLEMTSKPRILLIEDVKINPRKCRPGEKVKVEVTLRPFRKEAFKRSFEIVVPKDASGKGEVVVRGGGINEPDQESLLEGKTTIRDLGTLLKEISFRETNNQVVVEFVAQSPVKLSLQKSKASVDEDAPNPAEEEPELLSTIIGKKIKEGTMKIFDSNYFVDGFQRREITVLGNQEED